MSINKEQFRHMVKSTLEMYDGVYETNLYSREAEDLLMLTAASESLLGYYLKQTHGGPAKGVYQMEPIAIQQATERGYKVVGVPLIFMPYCLETQTIFARLYYTSFPEQIPARKEYVSDDDYWWALAVYYKKYWNTVEGKATVEKAYNSATDLVRG